MCGYSSSLSQSSMQRWRYCRCTLVRRRSSLGLYKVLRVLLYVFYSFLQATPEHCLRTTNSHSSIVYVCATQQPPINRWHQQTIGSLLVSRTGGCTQPRQRPDRNLRYRKHMRVQQYGHGIVRCTRASMVDLRFEC